MHHLPPGVLFPTKQKSFNSLKKKNYIYIYLYLSIHSIKSLQSTTFIWSNNSWFSQSITKICQTHHTSTPPVHKIHSILICAGWARKLQEARMSSLLLSIHFNTRVTAGRGGTTLSELPVACWRSRFVS